MSFEQELFDEYHKTTPSDDEKEYIISAIKAGIQSTEILNTLVIARSIKYNQRCLVGAMEIKDFKVFPILPMEVQKCYTILKVMIKDVWRKHLITS